MQVKARLTGLYVQSDPIGLVAGVNTFGYVDQNSLVSFDPFGLRSRNGRHASGSRSNASKGPTNSGDHAAGAASDFFRNYQDMRNANTVGGDKYFHCKANCEAAQRGPDGADYAKKISDAREWVDENVKGDSPAACAADQAANNYGRTQGAANPNTSCSILCGPYRPNGLPSNY